MVYQKLYSDNLYHLDDWKMNAKGVYNDIPYLIYSNAFPACYVGIHKDCKAFDLIGYLDIDGIRFKRCKNEITWVNIGDGKHRPDDFLWIGWDYGHAGQYNAYMNQYGDFSDDKKYTIEELLSDVRDAVYDVKHNLRYAMVNGKLRFIKQASFGEFSTLPSDCVIEYVSPTFNFATYDLEVIKNFERIDNNS